MDQNLFWERHLRVWKDEFPANDGPGGNHLSDEELCRLAGKGGLACAEASVLEHLSLCATCMSAWSDWHQALQDVSTLGEPEPFIESRILLEAAASAGLRRPEYLKTADGWFKVGLTVSLEDPQSGMITVEVLKQQAEAEGLAIEVEDKYGKPLLRGVIRNGRVARLVPQIQKVTLDGATVRLLK